MNNFLSATAQISQCGTWRYELRRVWEPDKKLLVVCMLNPSDADAEKNDPTVLALTHFAKMWGYGGIVIINLFAYRSSKPKIVFDHPMRHGPGNEHWQVQAIRLADQQCTPILVAWGNGGEVNNEFSRFLKLTGETPLVCLGTTQSGAPKHPMARGKHRIPRTQGAIAWPQ